MAYLTMAWTLHVVQELRFPYVLEFGDGSLYEVWANAGEERDSPWERRREWSGGQEGALRREPYQGDLKELGERLGVPAEMLPTGPTVVNCTSCKRLLGTVLTYGPYEGPALLLKCWSCGGASTPLGPAAEYAVTGTQREHLDRALREAQRKTQA